MWGPQIKNIGQTRQVSNSSSNYPPRDIRKRGMTFTFLHGCSNEADHSAVGVGKHGVNILSHIGTDFFRQKAYTCLRTLLKHSSNFIKLKFWEKKNCQELPKYTLFCKQQFL